MLRGSPVILYETLINVTASNYEDRNGFYFHCTGSGNIRYLPYGHADDGEVITKAFDATDSYTRAVFARKIFVTGTTATGIYVGRG